MPDEAAQMAEIDRQSFPDRTLPANAEAEPSAFSFSDEEIERVLRRGPNTEGSTLRIAMQYESHPTPREAQAFLKAEYGISGHSVTFLDGSSGFVAFSGQGMLLSRHGFSQEMRLRWPAVEQIVWRMIERDDYLGEMERLQLSEMKRILAEENLPVSTPRAAEDPPGEDTAESLAPEAADTPALDYAELASSRDPTVEENASEQDDDSGIDDALREWNGDAASKQAVVRYMKDHADDPGTVEWLKQEYGDDLPAFPVTSPAVSTDLPWSTVQRRIALLIREDRFYTEVERDALDGIDAEAIREHLERGDASAADEMLETVQTAQAEEQPHERFTVIETEGRLCRMGQRSGGCLCG